MPPPPSAEKRGKKHSTLSLPLSKNILNTAIAGTGRAPVEGPLVVTTQMQGAGVFMWHGGGCRGLPCGQAPV